MKKLLYIILILLISFGSSLAQNTSDYYPNIILIKIKAQHKALALSDGINHSDFQLILNHLQSASISKIFPLHQSPQEVFNAYGDSLVDLSLWYKVEYQSNTPVSKIITQFKSLDILQYVEQRSINKLLSTPNDPLIGNQFYLDNIRAYDAWDIETGDSNIVVGITDTGIDKLHIDLVDGIKYNYQDTVDGIDNDNDGFVDNFCGWDMANNDNNTQWNVMGHGTFVSGFVSAVPDNGIGIAGVGYHTKVLPVKVDDSTGYLSADYEGIVYAADHGASIINCSWGGTYGEQFGREVVNYASNNRGALVIAATGNSNNNVFLFPASYENVMSCAATDSMDVRWAASSYGTLVDISAPGTFVYSTWVYNAYIYSHGTSFSAPIVAGAAALVKAHFPQMTNWQIREQLRVSADIIDTIAGNIPTVGMMGSGRLNIFAALTDTLKPSIRFKNRIISQSNDTLFVSGDFINYLHNSSASLKATLNINSSYITPIDSVFNLGVMNTLTNTNNHSQAFSFKILPNIPVGSYFDIKVNYSDTNYSGFEYFRVFLNSDNTIIDTNKIITSVNSNSLVGFTDGSRMIGSGFNYKAGRNLLSYGGLLVASASNRVSDNIYGAGSYEDDFVAISAAQKIDPPIDGDQMWLNIYNDNNAGFTKNNIEVEQYSYAFSQSPLDKIVFLNYRIINKGNTNLGNVYVGFFADWDIGLSYANKAEYDNALKLAYTFPTAGGTYTGVQLVSGEIANCYNFDNDGIGGSINLYDGFMDFEKWDAMGIARHSAGALQSYGNDVSSLLSTGNFTIAIGDTLNLTFALLAGDYEQDIKLSAQAAKDWFFNTASLESPKSNFGLVLNQNTPNPFNNQTEISFEISKSGIIKLEIVDVNGKILQTIINKKLSAGKHQYKIDMSSYKAGVYFYRLINLEISLSRRMILE